ncbi:MAG: ABC transporter substrate-binding protein [Bacteroidales bacterium]
MKLLTRLIGLTLMILIPACQSSPGTITIGYVQITQDPSLDAAKAGLFRALADSGFIIGQNIKVIDNNAQGDLSMISTILQSFRSQGVDLVVTSSTPCMAAAAHGIRDVPVVFTAAFGPDQIGISPVPANLYGVYEPLPAEDFVGLMVECLPGLSRVGIPYNNSEPNAEYATGILKAEFSRRGIQVVTAPVSSVNDLVQAAQYLAGQRIDAFVTAADNTVNLGMPILARVASDSDIPLFVSDPPQVAKGAAIGYGSGYDAWGYQSGLKVVEILRGRAGQMIPIEPTSARELIVNLTNCADQGLAVPPAVLERASQIIQ